MQNLMTRELGQKISTKTITDSLFSKMIPQFREQQVPTRHNNIDKIFCSLWLNDATFITGSKDNKLVKWDLSTGECVGESIPLPVGNNVCDLNCGIHSLALSPSGHTLVSGSSDPAELALFDLETFAPLKILTGHSNWSFCSGFLSDTHVLSGSKDSRVAVWDVEGLDFMLNPLINIEAHKKVRDLVVFDYEIFATLGTEGCLKIWDKHTFQTISTIFLQETDELICLSIIEGTNLIAVGSQYHITLYDIISSGLVAEISSRDGDTGVRSLASKGNLLSIGGGQGKLSFFDVTASKYLNFADNGYLAHGGVASELNAIYTHSYSTTGTRLFVGGGPLMVFQILMFSLICQDLMGNCGSKQ